jgi:TPR repeat protein
LKAFLRFAAVICVVGFGKLIWQSIDAKPATTTIQPQLQQAEKPASPRGSMLIDPAGTEQKAEELYKQKHYSDARLLFELACNGEEMRACNYLGYLYANGLGGPRDLQRARDIYQKACAHGTLSSCASLGSIYQDAGNDDQARKYFQKACDGGVAEGCDLLRGLQ